MVVYSEPPPPCLQLPVDPMDATSGVRIVYRLNGIPRMAHLCGMCCLTPVTSVPRQPPSGLLNTLMRCCMTSTVIRLPPPTNQYQHLSGLRTQLKVCLPTPHHPTPHHPHLTIHTSPPHTSPPTPHHPHLTTPHITTHTSPPHTSPPTP